MLAGIIFGMGIGFVIATGILWTMMVSAMRKHKDESDWQTWELLENKNDLLERIAIALEKHVKG